MGVTVQLSLFTKKKLIKKKTMTERVECIQNRSEATPEDGYQETKQTN